MKEPTPEQVSAVKLKRRSLPDALAYLLPNVDPMLRMQVEAFVLTREAATYARGVEDAAKVLVDEIDGDFEDGTVRSQDAMLSRLIKQVRALLPGTARAGSDNKDGAA